ncbi:MAG: ribulose-phosphate 3-epimerase, partial [Bacilli bacterium]
MKKLPIIAPSLLAADFKHLDREIKTLLDHQIEFLHFDVMDGHFVPNLSFGIPLLESLKPHYRFFYDVHLMISNPIKMIPKFIAAGADLITFHYEAIKNKKSIQGLIDMIHALGAQAGMSVKPKTPIDVLTPYLPTLDLVLVMSVEPGFGGQSFMPASL